MSAVDPVASASFFGKRDTGAFFVSFQRSSSLSGRKWQGSPLKEEPPSGSPVAHVSMIYGWTGVMIRGALAPHWSERACFALASRVLSANGRRGRLALRGQRCPTTMTRSTDNSRGWNEDCYCDGSKKQLRSFWCTTFETKV